MKKKNKLVTRRDDVRVCVIKQRIKQRIHKILFFKNTTWKTSIPQDSNKNGALGK